MKDYKKLMDVLLQLPACSLITTGRTGSDFLQSLFDSHEQVLTYNGDFLFHQFWKESLCVSSGKFDLNDLIAEFIGKHIETLKSKYDLFERKHELGEEGDQSIDIDLELFRVHIVGLISDREVNSKNILLAVNGAYALCLGQDLLNKKLFLHHNHHSSSLKSYLVDFPDSKIICMTRDPRANFVSGITHWAKHDKDSDRGAHLYFYIERILLDAQFLNEFKNDSRVIKIEELGEKIVLEKLCDWLGVEYSETLEESTWGGMLWKGDKLSTRKKEGRGFSANILKNNWNENILKNNWNEKLSFIDKYIFNFITNKRLKYYGYQVRPIRKIDYFLVPILIFLPLRFELRYFKLSYLLNNRTLFLSNLYYFVKRIGLFLKYYIREIKSHDYLSKKLRLNN